MLDNIYVCGIVEAQEHEWASYKQSRKLEINRWLHQIYNWHEMWWEAYLSGHFWAEMWRTQRCEGMHSHMKRFVKQTHKLHEFLHHLERGIVDLRHKVVEADYLSNSRVNVKGTGKT